jgi:hypothetical protein
MNRNSAFVMALCITLTALDSSAEPSAGGFFSELSAASERLSSMGFRSRFEHVGGVAMAVFERGRSRRAVLDPAAAAPKACSPNSQPWVVSGVRVVIEEGRKDYPRGSAWVVRRLCTPEAGDVYYSEDIVARFPSLEELRAGTRDLAGVKEMAEALEGLITGEAVGVERTPTGPAPLQPALD